MLEIKRIKEAQVYQLVPLAVQFYAEGDLPSDFNDASFVANWKAAIREGKGMVFGAFVGKELIGSIGALIGPEFNSGRIFAYEMFWYVNQDYRQMGAGWRLLDVLEEAAKEEGAYMLDMAHLWNHLGKSLKTALEKRGYKPTEIHLVKNLE